MQRTLLTILAIGALLPLTASAYVGPGAGITLLGSLWGMLVGVVAAVGVILFWPVKILLRKRKAAQEAAAAAADAAEQPQASQRQSAAADEQQSA